MPENRSNNKQDKPDESIDKDTGRCGSCRYVYGGMYAGQVCVQDRGGRSSESQDVYPSQRAEGVHDREPEVSGKEALTTMRTIFGSIRSSDIARPVAVNTDFVTHI